MLPAMLEAIGQDVLVQVIAGLILAAILLVASGAWGRLRAWWPRCREHRRAVRSGAHQQATRAFNERLFGGVGRSEYMHLLNPAPGVVGVAVEIETSDGRQVWPVALPPGRHAHDVALAARAHFKLTDQFYALIHKPSGTVPEPGTDLTTLARPGDRLALVPHGEAVWGYSPRRTLANRARLLLGRPLR